MIRVKYEDLFQEFKRVLISRGFSAKAAEDAASVFAMSPAFHRTLLNAGGYTAEFDLAADTHYDASGLGRLQYRGAPPMLCLSVPFARKPSYKIDITNATSLAILPGCRVDGEWRYAYSPKYRQKELPAADGRAATPRPVNSSIRVSSMRTATDTTAVSRHAAKSAST